MDLNKLSLEEKVDLLLKYHISARRWAMVKMIIGLVLFIVLIVIPMVWLYYLYSSIDFSGITSAYENAKSISDGAYSGIDRINDILNNL